MTTATLKRLATGLIGSSATVLYTASGVAARIQAFTLKNTSGSAVTVTVYLPAGGSGAASNDILTTSLAAGASYVVNEALNQTIADGYSIAAIASTAGVVSAVISGVEVA